MLEIIKFKKLLKQYESIFSSILKEMSFEKVEDNKIIFKDKFNKEMKITISDDVIHFEYTSDAIGKYIIFTLPDKAEKFSDIKVNEIIKESRPKGCIIEKVQRVYGYSKASDKELSLVDLVSERYVFDGNMHFDKDWFLIDDSFLDKYSLLKTTFESHKKTLVMPVDSLRFYIDTPYSNQILLNGQDISYVYDIVDEADAISKIYDLYNGIINVANRCYIFNTKCFGYKETSGITDRENAICGCAKGKIYRGNNEAITYESKSAGNVEHVIERQLGISYDAFCKLDLDTQQKLIQGHKVTKKKNKDKMISMIGSGKYTTFVNLNDLTFESSRKRLDDGLSKVLKEKERNRQKSKVKSKISSVFKKS